MGSTGSLTARTPLVLPHLGGQTEREKEEFKQETLLLYFNRVPLFPYLQHCIPLLEIELIFLGPTLRSVSSLIQPRWYHVSYQILVGTVYIPTRRDASFKI